MVLKTRVALAKAGTRSMKTTIPEGIVEYLELDGKDDLEWKMDMRDGYKIAVVKKAEAKQIEGWINSEIAREARRKAGHGR
ncbi:MAG: hypothetical protein ACRD5H_05095 [Nitrososphaerales archaeon]